MGNRKFTLLAVMAISPVIGLTLLVVGTSEGQQVHRNHFETRTPSFEKGSSDGTFRETLHEMTDQNPHTGLLCEHLQLTADRANYIHYIYSSSRAPIVEELNISLWVKANRPGVQLLARLVLPRERDPNNLDDRLTTLVRGDQYELAGRWQRLELRRPVKLANEQQQLMRAQLKREVDFTDAYIDRLVLNVYGGPGLTDVWIDDLEMSPVQDNATFTPTSRPTGGGSKEPAPAGARLTKEPNEKPTATRAAVVEVNQDHLLVSGKPFFFRGIRHSDTPLKALRDAGFNTVWIDYATDPARIDEALNLGFWLVPSLSVTSTDPRLASLGNISQEVSRFVAGDAVLFWDLGGGLVDEQKETVSRAARAIHAADPQRPLGADVWDGNRGYSRNLDLLGVHRWPLMTMLEMSQYRQWLNQRRLLCRPGVFLWTWVQTHLPDWYTSLVFDKPSAAGFNEPIGPQPEQIRLLTYIALASGCRGLGFWSDRYLADSHQGRDRLLALALLNQEMQMLEPLLQNAGEPRWIDTYNPEVKAAVLRSDRGVLVLPIWLGKSAQYVPGQSAAAKLQMVVPEVPVGTQAWEVLPASVRPMQTDRVPGGTLVTIPEFSLTQPILFTSDHNPTGMLVRLQDQSRKMRKMSAQWAHDLAQVEFEKLVRVEDQLEKAGHILPDGPALLDDARKRLKECERHWDNGDFRQAYLEAERAMRPMRIIMRSQWDLAARDLDVPVSSPYALSFYTLPKHWRFVQQILQCTPGGNVLPDGDFELPVDQTPTAWVPQEATLDNLDLSARRLETETSKEGKQCLMLEIKPKKPAVADAKAEAPIEALERTYLAINSPSVRLPPGSLVRISGWIRIPNPITASVDGALFFDSAGGEPLAVRLTNSTGWKKFSLYREVPASGTINVTLALTGIGKVFFDDVRIEPLTPKNTDPRTTVAPPVAPAGDAKAEPVRQ